MPFQLQGGTEGSRVVCDGLVSAEQDEHGNSCMARPVSAAEGDWIGPHSTEESSPARVQSQ